MNLIVAVDKNWAIGKNNKLMWSIPADMKYFRETTKGNIVIMGRKTLESFPQGQPLKNRTNIVITKNPNYKVKDALIVHSIEEAMEEAKKYEGEIYVCLLYTSVTEPVKEYHMEDALMHLRDMETTREISSVIREY